MLTILFYIPRIDAQSGGLGTYVQLLARDLGKLCQLHVVTHQFADALPLENCTLHYLPSSLCQIAKCRSAYYRLLEQLHPDVCHVNGCWTPQCSWVAKWSRKYGLPVVYTPHGMLEPYALQRHYITRKWPAIHLYQRRSIACSTLVHATSEMEAQHLRQLGWNDKIAIVPNCVQIDKAVMRTNWESQRKILFLSRIHPKKGIPFLLEAVNMLKQELKDYECLIVGPSEPAYLKQLKDTVIRYHINNIVHFLQPVYGDDKWKLLANADFLVLPTLSENFGIIIAESLAAGTPVITTQETPWEEIVERQCGYWIPTGTEALVLALKQAITVTERQRHEMGLRGRRLIEEHYDSQYIAQRMLQLYQNI